MGRNKKNQATVTKPGYSTSELFPSNIVGSSSQQATPSMKTTVYAQLSSHVPMHPKVRSLANYLGIPTAQALGHLAAMWSWTVIYSKGGIIDPEDFGVAPMFLCDSRDQFKNLLEGMLETGWLDRSETHFLQIHDWDHHTGRVFEERVYERNKKQEQRLKKNACPEIVPEGQKENVPGDSPWGQNQNVPRQTKQNKTKQNKTNSNTVAENSLLADARNGLSADAEISVSPPARKKPKAASKEGTAGSKVWEAYSTAMTESWGFTPPRSAKASSQAQKLVELVGFENALKLAAYYPTRRSDFYVRSGHPFGALVTDYMALLREVSAGIKLTKGVVRDIVSKEETENACKRMSFEKETNIGLMTDEEFAQWENEQALIEGNKVQQLEASNGYEF